jgi:hypothetical protein
MPLSRPNRVRTTPGWYDVDWISGHRRAASAAKRMLACLAEPYTVNGLYAPGLSRWAGSSAPPVWASDDVFTTRAPPASLSRNRFVSRNGARWLAWMVRS